jgi:DNA polymerase-3 subunit beta
MEHSTKAHIMKITCLTENLKKTLQAVQRAVASKGVLPVLSNVLFVTDEASEGALKIVGTDLEIGIEGLVEANASASVRITLPARKLFEIVNKFPNDKIHFAFKENGSVDLLGEKLSFNLNTLPATDFPKLPQMNPERRTELGLQEFCQAIRQTTFATAGDSAKTILTGVSLSVKGNQLRLAATDGYRLAVRNIPLPTEMNAVDVIIPRRTLIELERLLKQDAQETFFMATSENSHILFESAGKVLTSRLIEGKYPDYNKILPKQFERKVWIDTRAFLEAVERVAIMASEQTHVVSFDIQPGEMTISAGAEQGQARETLEIKCEGEPLSISFNANYLIDVLRIFAEDSPHLLLQMNSEIQPVVAKSPDSDDYVCMLMPIKP